MEQFRERARMALGRHPFLYRLTFNLYRVVRSVLDCPRQTFLHLKQALWVPLMVRRHSRLARKAYFYGPLAAEPETFVLYRILGNDLPPRHRKGQTYANLEFMLEHEPELQDCSKVWVLNRIVDPGEHARLEKLLQRYGREYLTIPFRREEYCRIGFQYDGISGTERLSLAADPQSKVHQLELDAYILSDKNRYVMNINGSKNTALADGKQRAKWVMPWDGNCFLTESAWREIREAVRKSPWTKYFVVPMIRVGSNRVLLSDDFYPREKQEPQLIFRRDAAETFNESFPYGQLNKVELLKKLGVPGPWMHYVLRRHQWERPLKPISLEKYQFSRCGWVARLDSGSPEAEHTAAKRWLARKQGVVSFLRDLDQSMQGEGSGLQDNATGNPPWSRLLN